MRRSPPILTVWLPQILVAVVENVVVLSSRSHGSDVSKPMR